jgi:hypothetical protein
MLAIGLALSPWGVPAVSARQGSDDASVSGAADSPHHNGETTTTSSSGDGSNSGSGSSQTTPKPEDSIHSGGTHVETEAERQAGNIKLEAEKKAEDAKHKADEIRTKVEDVKRQDDKKLGDAKLKVCEKRQDGIQNIMGRVGERAQKQLDLYAQVSTRVQTFVTDKKLTVTNYEQLVADVATKKTAAQNAVNKVAADKAAFKCDGTDPVGTVDIFKADVAAQNEALKAYRASIKSLIDAVKAAAKDAAPAPTAPAPAPVTSPTPAAGGNQ